MRGHIPMIIVQDFPTHTHTHAQIFLRWVTISKLRLKGIIYAGEAGVIFLYNTPSLIGV